MVPLKQGEEGCSGCGAVLGGVWYWYGRGEMKASLCGNTYQEEDVCAPTMVSEKEVAWHM